ncbi:MAG: hypothetical protein HY020_09160 [Burkholderiales bacterium]|nr:hypothetical protein [Burkholderiales bacterium]
MPRSPATAARRIRPAAVLLFLLPIAAALLTGLAGGLLRAGVPLPQRLMGGWAGPAVSGHAFLMICGFMGTVIGLERAVALRHRAALLGPLASALAALAWLGGAAGVAQGLALAAGTSFVVVNAWLWRRQPVAHTSLLGIAALAWLAGLALHALRAPVAAVLAAWFAFLVLTIAAERLEMTRLMRHHAAAAPVLAAIVAALLLGAALSLAEPAWGGLVYGAALVALAAWLFACDIARRTVRAHGLSRYMAVCLLLGYGWLALAGLAWAANAWGWPARDAALHALALGFVFSMVLGHAPVILPALARVKLAFGPAFYAPLALLHGSLVLRLFVPGGQAPGSAGNALALAVFVATVLHAAWRWRRTPAA